MESRFEKFFEVVKGRYELTHSFEETYIFAMGYVAALVGYGILSPEEYDKVFGKAIQNIR